MQLQWLRPDTTSGPVNGLQYPGGVSVIIESDWLFDFGVVGGEKSQFKEWTAEA